MEDKIKCAICDTNKPRDHFISQKTGNMLKTCQRCRTYIKNYTKKHPRNKDTMTEEQKRRQKIAQKKYYEKYKQTEKYKEKLRVASRKWYHANKEKRIPVIKKYIVEHKEKIKAWQKSGVKTIIKSKINAHRHSDEKYKRQYNEDDYITLDFIMDLIEKSQKKCTICDIDLKYTQYDTHDRAQFSIDRLDNAKAHTKDNVRIICAGCNYKGRK